MWFRLFVVITSCALTAWVRAEPQPLLTQAVKHWEEGLQELAFTQRTRVPNSDGTTRYERVERYDPSQPDDRRWQLLSVDRRPPTDAERQDIELKRNRKPRKRAGNPPARYLDLESARLVNENEEFAHFELGIRPEAARFIPLDKVVVRITVEKATATIDHISAFLREPMRIAFGAAKILDVDLDLQFTDPGPSPAPSVAVTPNSTARVTMSKFGDPLEFTWSDFKEVPVYAGGSPR